MALDFRQRAAQDHLAGDPSHFPEIYGEGGKSAKDELIERKVIVTDQSDLLSWREPRCGESFQQFRQLSVKAGAGDKEKVSSLDGLREIVQDFHGNLVLFAE